MSIIGLFAKDWGDAPPDDCGPQYPISLKKFGGSITFPADSPAADQYERLCCLSREWRARQLEEMTLLILGVRPKR